MYEAQVRDLARARREVQVLLKQEEELGALIEREHPEVVQIREDISLAKATVEARERQLRDVIENRYAVFEEEPDHPALGLRQYADPRYDEFNAITLAVDHRLYGLVKLDRKAFEKVAPTLWPHVCDWDRKKLTATIKSDLSEWESETEHP